MKKLIISIVATASLALVAKADGALPNATSFEKYEGAFNVGLDDNGADAGDKYWSGGDEGSEFLIKALAGEGGLGAKSVARPKYWDGEDDANALSIDTDVALSRNVAAGGAAQTIGDGLYFDSMVQFTATDTAPTVTDGDKLIVWLKEIIPSEEEGGQPTYKLCVTAATWDDVGAATRVDYVNTNTEIAVDKDEWHRLTISAVFNEDRPEFQVFVDGKLFQDGDVNKFLSLSGSLDSNLTTLTSVSFQGKGAIDDLVWTTEDPFVAPTKTSTVTIVDTDENGIWSYSVDGGADVAMNDGENTVKALADANEVVFKCELVNGYSLLSSGFVAGTPGESTTIWTKPVKVAELETGYTFTPEEVEEPVEPVVRPFTVTIAGVDTPFKTLAEAVAAAAGGETIKVAEDATRTEKVTISSITVIDLNGRTLTESVNPGDGFDYGAFYVGTNGKLTITDSSAGAKGKIASNGDVVIGNYGTVTVNAGTIESANTDNAVDVSIYNFYYNGTVYGKATINGNVTSVWNCGVLTVAETATVNYLDNSGAATIANGATVNAVVLMDGTDAAEVTGAGTLRAPEGLEEKVVSGVDGYNVAYKDGVYKLEEDVVTVKPGQTAEVDTEEAANAVEIAVDVPAGVVITEEAYKAYFEKGIKYNPETLKYEVSAVLKNEVKPVIEATTDDEGNVVKPAISFGPNGEVTINISNELPGLFYGVKYATTVGGVKGAKAIKGLTVTPAEGATAGFFSVEVDFTDKNFETPAAAQQN